MKNKVVHIGIDESPNIMIAVRLSEFFKERNISDILLPIKDISKEIARSNLVVERAMKNSFVTEVCSMNIGLNYMLKYEKHRKVMKTALSLGSGGKFPDFIDN